MQTFDFFNSRDTDILSTHNNTTHYPNIYHTYPIPYNRSGVEVKSYIACGTIYFIIVYSTPPHRSLYNYH